ncbi:hypothetical protein PZA11_004615 [Diplocarpon coronariae]
MSPAFVLTLLLALWARHVAALASTDTITWGGDNSRTGYQTNHNMDPSIVGSSQFGQLFKTSLPGSYGGVPEQLFSQPLVYTPSDGVQYVYVATTQNNVYKINAKTGAIVLARSLHIPFLTADLDGCVDINPHVGVTATGVIDAATHTLYLTAKTYADQAKVNVAQGKPAGRYYLHALSADDLSERAGFPVSLEGTVARNNAVRSFNGGIHHQRPALLHAGPYIYAGFASHCVQYNFTGWIMGWDKATGATVERYATEGLGVDAQTKGAGVWMSGGGIASDDAGSMFFATGNGYASQLSTIPVNGRNPPTSLEEAAVHMTINADGSLSLVDFFMPWEKTQLDGADKDLGTSPLELLPSQFACGDVKRIGVVTGKSGKTYWLNLDDLGGYQNGPNKLDKIIQVYQNENSVYAGAGVYPLEGGYIYINVINYPTHVFKFSCSAGVPSFAKVADSPTSNAAILGVGHGTTTSLNGQAGTGLVWTSDVRGDNLRIYNAVPQNGLLTMTNSFNVDGITKFTRPVFGDGRVYLGTTKGTLYGFGSPVNLPINCTSPVQFGSASLNNATAAQTVTCRAVVGVTIANISLSGDANFAVSGLAAVPATLAAGATFRFDAVFNPKSVGVLSADVVVATTNGVAGYSTSTPITLRGTGQSASPLLQISPVTLAFEGVIAGGQPGGVDQSLIFTNLGSAPLTISGVEWSTAAETGPFVAANGTAAQPRVGPFTFTGLPTTIPANAGVTVSVNFDSSVSGNYGAYARVTSDGGTRLFDVVATAGSAPAALVEFQTPDGAGWVAFDAGQNFTFGNVTENTTRSLRMRVTNNGPADGSRLSLTVSKPPFGVAGLIGANNQVDLAEGTTLGVGENATATLYCSVPKRQWNTDPYSGAAHWTLNLNDPNFGKHDIGFLCQAVAEQAAPLQPSGLGVYRYAGCYKENNPGRQLKTQLGASSTMTSAVCIAACAAAGVTYCGTQYNRECWGGPTIPTLQVADGNCDYPCTGDVNQICGGNGVGDGAGGSYISLFAKSGSATTPGVAPGGPYTNPGVGGYASIGCYTESTTGRALPNGKAVTTKTVASCVAACAASNNIYAGLEYGGERSASSASSSRPVTLSSSAVASGISSAAATSSGLAPPASGGLTSTSAATDLPSSLSLSGASTVTSAPSSAPPAPTGPAIRPVVSGYSFLGCYTESTTGRALSLSSYASDTMTLESCAAYCSAYSMFGVEYGRECYCGNSLGAGSIKATNQADCSFLCPGDRATYCGAGVRLQLYGLAATGPSLSGASSTGSPASSSSIASSAAGSSTGSFVSSPTGSSVGASTGLFVSSATDAPAGSSTGPAALSSTGSSIGSSTGSSAPISSPKSPATSAMSTITTLPPASPTSLSTPPTTTSARKPSGPTIVPSIGLYHYLGCYTEGTNVRALAGALYANDSLTMQTCAQACGEYTYFGAEYGRECWCGNSFGAGSVLAPKGDAECTKLCAGDGSQYCGNGNRLSVYIKNGTVGGGSSIPSAGPSAATVSSTVSSLSTAASTSSIAPSSTSGVASSPASSATSSSAPSVAPSSASSVAPSSASSATSSSASSATSSSASSASPSSASSVAPSSASSATSSSASSVASPSTSSVTALATSSTASSSTTSSSPTATSLAQSSSSAKTSTSTTSTTSSSKAAAYTGPPITSSGNVNYTYYSCISEPSAGRLLPSQVDNNATSMSIERCLGRCGPRGYKYVGVEYGVECWCGNTLNLAGNAGATPARNVSDSQCSFKCPGNATEFCGAGSRLNLYYYDFAKAAANAG